VCKRNGVKKFLSSLHFAKNLFTPFRRKKELVKAEFRRAANNKRRRFVYFSSTGKFFQAEKELFFEQNLEKVKVSSQKQESLRKKAGIVFYLKRQKTLHKM
jgi:hypothetical protein